MAAGAKGKTTEKDFVRRPPKKVSFETKQDEPLIFDEQGRLRKDLQAVVLNFAHFALEHSCYIGYSGNKAGTAIKVFIKGRVEYAEWHSNLEKVASHLVSLREAASEATE